MRSDWEALRRSWTSLPQGTGFSDVRKVLNQLKAEHDGLPAEQSRRLNDLQQGQRNNQMKRYLDRFTLGQARIPGVGRARVATLASHGIHTAGDLVSQRLLTLPGFGPATVSNLLQWRRTFEASFRFDPSRGVPASETALVERDIAAKKARLEREVSNGLARLRTAAAQQGTLWRSLEGRAAELVPLYAQAIADAAAAPGDKTSYHRMIGLSGLAVGLAVVSAPPASKPPSIVAAAQQPLTPTPEARQPPPEPARPLATVGHAPVVTSSAPPETAQTAGVQRPATFANTAKSSAFQDGYRDRQAWEQWFASLSPDQHAGAYFWSGQRSLKIPGSCNAPPAGVDVTNPFDWSLGCILAQTRLKPSDQRRSSEPDYRAGWNSL